MMHACECVLCCVVLCSGLGRAASDCRATHQHANVNIELSVKVRNNTVTVHHSGENVIFEHYAAVMPSVRD